MGEKKKQSNDIMLSKHPRLHTILIQKTDKLYTLGHKHNKKIKYNWNHFPGRQALVSSNLAKN